MASFLVLVAVSLSFFGLANDLPVFGNQSVGLPNKSGTIDSVVIVCL